MTTCIDFPFRLNSSRNISMATTYEAVVRCQVIDALMTNQGERVMRPRYGCDIQAALFDPTDELERRDAGTQIRSRLEDLVPRCIVRDIKLELPPHGPRGYITITILYRPSLYASDVSVTVPVSSEFFNRSGQQTSSLEVSS
jgi:phage baseplate assembly protein W